MVPNKLGKVTVQQFAAHYGLDLEDLMAANNYDSILTVLEGDYEVFVPITESDAIQAGLIKPEPVPEKIIAKPNNGKKTNTAKTTTSIKNVNSIGRPYYSKTETASRQ